MSTTIEYTHFRFWDWDAIFPGETVADAFLKAGGRVACEDGEVIVLGLSYKEAMAIAGRYQADYLGPVISDSVVPENLKDVTNLSFGTDLIPA
jgi:hypothetical protein